MPLSVKHSKKLFAAILVGLFFVPMVGESIGHAESGAPGVAGASSVSPKVVLDGTAVEAKLAAIDKVIDESRKEFTKITPRKTLVASRGRARARALYKLLRAGMLPLGGGFTELAEHARKVERLRHATRLDFEEESKLVGQSNLLATTVERLTKERAELAERKTLIDTAKVAIDEEKRRREAFERTFAASSFAPSSTGRSGEPADMVVYGPSGKTTPDSLDAGSFASRKGRLAFPVTGKAEVRPTAKDGGPAIEIRSTLGAEVRAVHPGRVAFADRYGTYGPLVILDHGDHYYTVMANLGTMDVKVGDQLSAGEKVGTVGDDGRGASLYFEVRQGSEKLSPTTWLGL